MWKALFSFQVVLLGLVSFSVSTSKHIPEEIIYEHSREYRVINDNDDWENLMLDWIAKTRKLQTAASSYAVVVPTLKEIEEYIKTFEPAFKSAQTYINGIVKRSAVLTGRLKAAYSVQEKLQRKDSSLQNLTDIIGLRLTCQSVDDSLRIRDEIKKDVTHFEILEEICYGMCPGSGKYKTGGYRRIHLIINIKPENKPAELQIGTPFTDYWADWNHDFIYKGPLSFKNDSLVQNYSLAMADYFLVLDTDRNNLPKCPTILEKADPLKVLEFFLPADDALKMFKKLGQPPNACYWWYDMKLALPEKECGDESQVVYKVNNYYNLAQQIYGEDFNGGHTRDYVILDDNVDAWDDLMKNWRATHRGSPYSFVVPTLKEIEEYIKTFEPAFKSAQTYINGIVKHSAVLTGRLKAAYSVQEKLQRKDSSLQNLTDIIGLRLTCQSVDDSLRIRDEIKKDVTHFEILEEICYGMCPGSGKYKTGGYRRIHLIINIKPENKPAELQIGTPYTNYWADWSHDFLYKGPPQFQNSSLAQNFSLSLADYFLQMDTDRTLLPLCPKRLNDSNALTILRESLPEKDAIKIYKKIGKPPNACFWWFDMKLALPDATCGGKNIPSDGEIIRLNVLFLFTFSFILIIFLF